MQTVWHMFQSSNCAPHPLSIHAVTASNSTPSCCAAERAYSARSGSEQAFQNSMNSTLWTGLLVFALRKSLITLSLVNFVHLPTFWLHYHGTNTPLPFGDWLMPSARHTSANCHFPVVAIHRTCNDTHPVSSWGYASTLPHISCKLGFSIRCPLSNWHNMPVHKKRHDKLFHIHGVA